MVPVGFEPTTPAGERLHTYALLGQAVLHLLKYKLNLPIKRQVIKMHAKLED